MTKAEWKRIMLLRLKAGTCVCYLCGEVIKKQKDLTLEHVMPRSRFKNIADDHNNWKPSCAKCNTEKGALTLDEYVQWKRLELLRIGQAR